MAKGQEILIAFNNSREYIQWGKAILNNNPPSDDSTHIWCITCPTKPFDPTTSLQDAYINRTEQLKADNPDIDDPCILCITLTYTDSNEPLIYEGWCHYKWYKTNAPDIKQFTVGEFLKAYQQI